MHMDDVSKSVCERKCVSVRADSVSVTGVIGVLCVV
jgi:hypothetical protein